MKIFALQTYKDMNDTEGCFFFFFKGLSVERVMFYVLSAIKMYHDVRKSRGVILRSENCSTKISKGMKISSK